MRNEITAELVDGSNWIVRHLEPSEPRTYPELTEAAMAGRRPDQSRTDHREAVRLSWKSRHIPFGSLLIGALVLAGVLSAILMMFAQGPSNPIP